MDLYNFHRILIASVILFCLGFGMYSYQLFTRTDQTANLTMSIVSAVIGVGLIAYLIYFNNLVRKITSRRHERTIR